VISYSDAASSQRTVELKVPIDVAAVPEGTITVQDAGLIRVKVPEGTPPPTVRVRGMSGSVIYEVTPRN